MRAGFRAEAILTARKIEDEMEMARALEEVSAELVKVGDLDAAAEAACGIEVGMKSRASSKGLSAHGLCLRSPPHWDEAASAMRPGRSSPAAVE